MAYTFKLNKESLKREYSVYVVIAQGNNCTRLYIGKTGDNREGCNPIISRCGNHFSYNKIHSQVRNKIEGHEEYEYTYIFDHFGEYSDDKNERKRKVDLINEMERWLNIEIQTLAENIENCIVENPFKGVRHISNSEKEKRRSFHTQYARMKISGIIDSVLQEIRR